MFLVEGVVYTKPCGRRDQGGMRNERMRRGRCGWNAGREALAWQAAQTVQDRAAQTVAKCWGFSLGLFFRFVGFSFFFFWLFAFSRAVSCGIWRFPG